MMHATEDEVCEWFPGGRGVTEKPASCSSSCEEKARGLWLRRKEPLGLDTDV